MRFSYLICILIALTGLVAHAQENSGAETTYKPLVSKNAGINSSATAPPDIISLDKLRKSNRDYFRISVGSEPDPVSINQFHIWTLHVETAAGQAVANAKIQIGGGMPAHQHDLPTVPAVTAYLGDGNYRIEGLNFHMPGLWQVMFYINADNVTDTAIVDLAVE